MSKRILMVAALLGAAACERTSSAPVVTVQPEPGETRLSNIRQLTFGGENAEAYWSFGGDQLIFQTTREGVACDQIMKMPATGGPATMVSSGEGRSGGPKCDHCATMREK